MKPIIPVEHVWGERRSPQSLTDVMRWCSPCTDHLGEKNMMQSCSPFCLLVLCWYLCWIQACKKKNLWKLLKSQEHIGPQDLNPMVEHGHQPQPITPFTRPLVFFTTGWLMRWLVVKVMSPCSFCLAGYLQSASFHPELLSNLFKMGYFLVHPFFAKPFRRNALANSMPF